MARCVVSARALPYPCGVTDWHRYLTTNARAAFGDDDDVPPFVSGQLLCRHAAAIGVPIVEVSARRAAVLAAFLRACRQADTIAVIAVDAAPRRSSPQAPARIMSGIVGAARAGLHDRPLVVVARADDAPLWYAPGVAAVDAVLERLARDIDAGYGAIGLGVELAGDGAALAALAPSLLDLDLGIELEVAAGEDAALLLAEIDDRGLAISAVRGANLHDEVGAATRVVELKDLKALAGVDAGGLRVNLDVIVAAAIARANAVDDDAVEAVAWAAISRAIAALKADGSASLLADALDGGAA